MLTTIDTQGGTGNESPLIGDQKQDPACDLTGVAQTTNRDLGDDFFQHIFRYGPHHIRINVTGGNGIYGYSLCCTFLGQETAGSVSATSDEPSTRPEIGPPPVSTSISSSAQPR